MTNNITSLRSTLFDTLADIKSGKLDLDRAREINNIAQTIINSAKVEVDFVRATGVPPDTGFIPQRALPAPHRPAALPQPAANGKTVVDQKPGVTVTRHYPEKIVMRPTASSHTSAQCHEAFEWLRHEAIKDGASIHAGIALDEWHALGEAASKLRHHLAELAKISDRAALVLATLEGEDAIEEEMIQQIIDGISTWAPPAMLGTVDTKSES